MNIQREIDTFLSLHPEVRQYIDWAKYVEQGMDLPEGTTHTLKLANLTSDDLIVALKAKTPYGALADALLKVL